MSCGNDTSDFKNKNCELKKLDEERKYLEDLLTRRFHFFFIFAGAIAAGLTSVVSEKWVSAPLLLAALISFLFWRALFRTHVLLREILRLCDESKACYPLARARANVKEHYGVRQANHYIAQWIPGVITFSFATASGATFLSLWDCLPDCFIVLFTVLIGAFGLGVVYIYVRVDHCNKNEMEKKRQSQSSKADEISGGEESCDCSRLAD